MAYTKVVLDIPKEYKPIDRVGIADLIVEHIVERTQKGFDKNNRKFKPYTKEYKDSIDFKNANKPAGIVNLELTGDMLAELSMLRHRKGKVTIGYEKTHPEAGKVEGHVTGKLGRATKNYKRDFLGITKKEKDRLISLYLDRKAKGL